MVDATERHSVPKLPRTDCTVSLDGDDFAIKLLVE